MSQWGNILDGLLERVVTAVPGTTTAREVVRLDRIQQFPFCYAWMSDVTADRLEVLQEQRTLSAVLVYVRNDATQEELYTDLDAIRQAIYVHTDESGESPVRTLSSSVDSLHISSTLTFEQPDPGTIKGAQITVACLKDYD